MELVKHNDELQRRIELLDVTADLQLAKELMELHQAKCAACQEDRLRCATRPACKDRNFLNALIEIGVEVIDLPDFCYSQNVEQIRRLVLEKKGRRMIDRRLPIKDLLQSLGVSSIRHFTTKYKKEWDNFASVHEGNLMLVTGDGLLFRFDFTRGIVTVNPSKDRIRSYNIFKLYCDLFSERYQVNMTVKDVTQNWWILSLTVDDSDAAAVKALQKGDLAESFDAIYRTESEGKVQIQVEVLLDTDAKYLESEDLSELFVKASKLCK
ncbi:MAG: hypothetical protein JW779_04220 [Candidatus Thorarchaeota archaeon]|nr:hypothetical protein [Candidatus Thorarchaeota archaeon]